MLPKVQISEYRPSSFEVSYGRSKTPNMHYGFCKTSSYCRWFSWSDRDTKIMFYCHSVCSGVLKFSGQNYDNFILSKSLLYLSVVVSMCLPSTFSQKHKHCFQTILLLRLLLRLLFGIVLLYWIMCLVFLHHIQGFWSRKNYELVMHPCLWIITDLILMLHLF